MRAYPGDFDARFLLAVLALLVRTHQLAQRRFCFVELLFDDEPELTILILRQRDITIPDVHESRVVKDHSVLDQRRPVFTGLRAEDAHAMLIIGQRRLDRQPTGGRGFFIERDHDLEPFAFIQMQRDELAGADLTHLLDPFLADRLEQVGHHRASIVHEAQVRITIASSGVDFAVERNGNDFLAGRRAQLDLFAELETRHSVRGACTHGEPDQEDHGELCLHGATPWSLAASPLAKV